MRLGSGTCEDTQEGYGPLARSWPRSVVVLMYPTRCADLFISRPGWCVDIGTTAPAGTLQVGMEPSREAV
jgi:hypothetical protein